MVVAGGFRKLLRLKPRFTAWVQHLIEAETRAPSTQIRAEVADLTLIAAEKVTGQGARLRDQRRLIEEAISDLDFSVLERERV